MKLNLTKADYLVAKKYRNKAAARIVSLCGLKGYKHETYMLGVNILDKFLAKKILKGCVSYLQEEKILLLVVTSTILAAKVE